MHRAPQDGRDGIAGQRRKDAQAQTKSVEASLIRLCSVKTHHPHLSSFPRLGYFFVFFKSLHNKLLGWQDGELGYFKT